jgi:hypothetical protein
MKTDQILRRCEFLRSCLSAGLGLVMLTGLIAIGPARGDDRPLGEWTQGAGASQQVLMERVEKVYSDGRWNGRPVIIFWKGRYYLFIRTGSGHASPDGVIRLITTDSNNPRQWSTSPYTPKNYRATVAAGKSVDPIGPGPLATVIIDTPLNEQEVHVLVTPERLFAYTVIEDVDTESVPGTMVSSSDNGTDWSDPEFVFEPGWSFWKPRSHDGVHYVAGDIMTGNKRVDLLSSTDGFQWKKVSTIGEARQVEEGLLTETDLLFLKDGTLLAVTRQGRLFKAAPPYTQWTSRKWSTALQGPALELVGDTILASGRISPRRFPDDQIGSRRNALFVIDPETLERHWQMNMPTQWGADCSYPHILALDNHRAVITWYDGEWYEEDVPKQSDIFVAFLRVK